MTRRNHVENDEDLVYPHKVRLFFIENEHYWMNVTPGANTMTLDHWLALQREEGYSLSDISVVDESRIIVVVDREEELLDWEEIVNDDSKGKRSRNGNGKSNK